MWTTAATTEEQSIEHYFVNGFSRFSGKMSHLLSSAKNKVKICIFFFFLLMTVNEMSPGF